MQREKLLVEHNSTKLALVDKINFIYSERFYELDELEQQKYMSDKMATEAHLSTLSNILWGNKFQTSGLGGAFALALLTSMMGGGSMFGSPSPSFDYLKKEIDKLPVKEAKEEVKEIEDEHIGVHAI